MKRLRSSSGLASTEYIVICILVLAFLLGILWNPLIRIIRNKMDGLGDSIGMKKSEDREEEKEKKPSKTGGSTTRGWGTASGGSGISYESTVGTSSGTATSP